ncbi:MAG: DNA mismatch repair endonuclease MutL [Deltaproteobacteria bacterium]|jgi:DNA mismatch repair protein MutL|nr:DNA mismatch repair endonuclease MutL [Deltaproteobacteria bacterium]
MSSRIKLLPENLINRIAAGEVVERPASILKELLENSLDAGATNIEIHIEGGGKKLVQVSDNGCGLNREELFLCLERHATSKLSADSDLMQITTLGFRGEALPSIASVSKMTIVSRGSDGEGNRLRVEGGRVVDLSPAASNQGTVIEVRDLFFNVPARRKFLKTDATETTHLVEAAQRYALSRLNLRLKLTDGSRELLSVDENNDLPSRVMKILGRDAAASLKEFSVEKEDLKIRGWLGDPARGGRTNSSLFLFVLGRPVRDKLLTKAIMQGYGRTLAQGRWPSGLVFIDLAPERVDVNVHPAKTEVRFRESGFVFDALSRAVKDAVDVSPLVGGRVGLNAAPSASHDRSPQSADFAEGEARADLSALNGPAFDGASLNETDWLEAGKQKTDWLEANKRETDWPEAGKRHLAETPEQFPEPSFSDPSSAYSAHSAYAEPTRPERRRSLGIGPAFSMGRANAGQVRPKAAQPLVPPWLTDEADEAERPLDRLNQIDRLDQIDQSDQIDPTAGAKESREFGESAEERSRPPDGASEALIRAKENRDRENRAKEAPWPETNVKTGLFAGQNQDGAPGAIRPLAQLHQSYILAQGPDGLYIIDQHAAHERILFNSLKSRLKESGLDSQNLLFPETLELGAQEARAAEALAAPLRRLGFQFDPFGESAWALRGIPSLLSPGEAKEALTEILRAAKGRLRSFDGAGLEQIVDDLSGSWLYSLACRAAVKAGDRLEMPEMEDLIRALTTTESGGYCPHGRPAVLVMTTKELLKRFGRS